MNVLHRKTVKRNNARTKVERSKAKYFTTGGNSFTFRNIVVISLPVSFTGIAQYLFFNSFRHALKKNHHLKSIRKHEDKYILTFQPTQTVSGATEEIKPGHPLVIYLNVNVTKQNLVR